MRRALVRLGVALLTALVLLVAYGLLVEPRLVRDEERFPVDLPRLPADAPSRTVAVFSDLQVGMWFANTGMVEDIVERVVEERPSAALIGGDFVYSHDPVPAEQVDRAVDLVAPLTAAGIPTFAVLGNHDYAVGAVDELVVGLESIGVRVLRNEAAPVPGTGAGAAALHVVGLGPARPDRTDVAAALAQLPNGAPRVVLAHNPTSFPQLPADSAPLAVAGHTHCGQVAVPFTPEWSFLELTAEERYVVDGWAPPGYGAVGNRLHVNCGIGFSVAPIRIAAPPQLVLFDLQPTTRGSP
ncbi:metallophosphoesterase [Actinomycetospora cinnamomea]|uniref:Calcineurin-like phosphoesterase domain-containing protein n=1 Tax=Actinomycetospora cinnamomea TaxID=663609 RepID=A0A2U1EUR0_9PSEU|nr:metallophosphoesterase [Actinomycetospora cinnamomea]PVZ03665.1 hypothetical protein C8D89_12021 [Actinomycetospora cinnamomea]